MFIEVGYAHAFRVHVRASVSDRKAHGFCLIAPRLAIVSASRGSWLSVEAGGRYRLSADSERCSCGRVTPSRAGSIGPKTANRTHALLQCNL